MNVDFNSLVTDDLKISTKKEVKVVPKKKVIKTGFENTQPKHKPESKPVQPDLN